MICNVFGKAVTSSTAMSLLEYKNDTDISSVELAKVALALKNSQGKGKDEEEALRCVEILRNQSVTLGWIYNATGRAITLLDSRNEKGDLASTPYPLRIENGQWGLILHQQSDGISSGGVVYEGMDVFRNICYWCVSWKNQSGSSAKVHVKIGRGIGEDWYKNDWNNVFKTLENCGPLHRAEEGGCRSVISTSSGPHVVFEALLTLYNL